jgi:hypothetical protein
MSEIPELEGLLAGSAVFFAVMAGMYVYFAVCLSIIAGKTGTPGGWMAWIPIANLVLMARIAGRSGAWAVLCLIPLLNIIFLVILWVDIAKARGKAGWMGALIIVPLVNFLVPAILASGPPSGGPGHPGAAASAGLPYGGATPPFGAVPPQQPYAQAASSSMPFSARCQTCGAYLAPGEQFCGDCGTRVVPPQQQQQYYQPPPQPPHAQGWPPQGGPQTPPYQQPMPPGMMMPPQPVPAKSGGGGGVMTAVFVVLGIAMLGGAWWFFSSMSGGRGIGGGGGSKAGMGDIPKRMAGVMKEFPVDSSAKTPARPAGVISHDLRANRASAAKKSMPAGWLPPGVTVPAIAPYTETITTARYKSPEAPGSVYVSVMQTEQELDFTTLETAVAQGSSGANPPVGAHVDSPSGEGYDGVHMSAGGSDVYVLHDVSPHSHIVILVFSPASDTKEVSARLASSVGNGNGLADYPETQDSLAALPPEPDGMTLEGVMDYDASQFFSEPGIQQAMGGATIPADVQSQVKQFIPDRVTVAQYRDRARNEYTALAGDYGGRAKSWWIWGMIRSVSAVGGAATATAGDNSGLTFVDGQNRVWLHRSGSKIILLTAAASAPAANLNALASRTW